MNTEFKLTISKELFSGKAIIEPRMTKIARALKSVLGIYTQYELIVLEDPIQIDEGHFTYRVKIKKVHYYTLWIRWYSKEISAQGETIQI